MYLQLSASNGRKDCRLFLFANWSQQELMRGWVILDEFFQYFLNTGTKDIDLFHPGKFPKTGLQLDRWHLNSSVLVLALRSL